MYDKKKQFEIIDYNCIVNSDLKIDDEFRLS